MLPFKFRVKFFDNCTIEEVGERTVTKIVDKASQYNRIFVNFLDLWCEFAKSRVVRLLLEVCH